MVENSSNKSKLLPKDNKYPKIYQEKNYEEILIILNEKRINPDICDSEDLDMNCENNEIVKCNSPGTANNCNICIKDGKLSLWHIDLYQELDYMGQIGSSSAYGTLYRFNKTNIGSLIVKCFKNLRDAYEEKLISELIHKKKLGTNKIVSYWTKENIIDVPNNQGFKNLKLIMTTQNDDLSQINVYLSKSPIDNNRKVNIVLQIFDKILKDIITLAQNDIIVTDLKAENILLLLKNEFDSVDCKFDISLADIGGFVELNNFNKEIKNFSEEMIGEEIKVYRRGDDLDIYTNINDIQYHDVPSFTEKILPESMTNIDINLSNYSSKIVNINSVEKDSDGKDFVGIKNNEISIEISNSNFVKKNCVFTIPHPSNPRGYLGLQWNDNTILNNKKNLFENVIFSIIGTLFNILTNSKIFNSDLIPFLRFGRLNIGNVYNKKLFDNILSSNLNEKYDTYLRGLYNKYIFNWKITEYDYDNKEDFVRKLQVIKRENLNIINDMAAKNKYLKYKNKYLLLKKELESTNNQTYL